MGMGTGLIVGAVVGGVAATAIAGDYGSNGNLDQNGNYESESESEFSMWWILIGVGVCICCVFSAASANKRRKLRMNNIDTFEKRNQYDNY